MLPMLPMLSMLPPMMPRRAFFLALPLAAVLALAACDMLRSDSANAMHGWRQQRDEALRGNRIASRQAAPATPVGGDALVRLLAGKTHVHEYVKQIGARPYLITYDFYRADGGYIALDTSSRREAASEPVGRWRVERDVLCISTPPDSEDRCYKIRLQADGAIQYWIHKPGDDFDGLITSQVSIVRDGLQQPAVIPLESR